jgi:hypothetical protein
MGDKPLNRPIGKLHFRYYTVSCFSDGFCMEKSQDYILTQKGKDIDPSTLGEELEFHLNNDYQLEDINTAIRSGSKFLIRGTGIRQDEKFKTASINFYTARREIATSVTKLGLIEIVVDLEPDN